MSLLLCAPDTTPAPTNPPTLPENPSFTQTPQKRKYTVRNRRPGTVITKEIAAKIVEERAKGLTYDAIAKGLEINTTTVMSHVKRQREHARWLAQALTERQENHVATP